MPNYASVPAPLHDLTWTSRPLHRGSKLFREGEPADRVYVLDSGLIKLSHETKSQQRIVRLVHPGELIGGRSPEEAPLHRFTAEALTDCVVCEVERAKFQKACDRSSAVLEWVAAQMERRLIEVERRIDLIAYTRVDVRILRMLVDLAEAVGERSGESEEPVQLPLSQTELAQLAGATRETASTALNQFVRRGLLRLGRRQIELVSIQAVRDAADA